MADRTLKIDVTVDDHGAVRTLKDVEQGLDHVGRAATGGSGMLQGMLSTFAGFVSAEAVLGGLRTAVNAVSDAISAAVGASFTMNASLETSTLQFATLMGSADRAKTHVESLFAFAASTPFETGPIINASRQLEIAGGAALNTTQMLTLMGNSAAVAGVPIDEIGRQVARMYGLLQAGQPIGESTLRLQEMGVISPQVALQMRDLATSGGDTMQAFSLLTAEMGRFDGAMTAQASTWAGVTSTFKETMTLLLADAFQPLFASVRDLIGVVNQLFGSEGMASLAAATAATLKDVLPTTAEMFTFLTQMVLGTLIAFDKAQTGFRLLSVGLDLLGARIAKAVADQLTTLKQLIDAVESVLPGALLKSSAGYETLWNALVKARQAQFDYTISARETAAAAAETSSAIDGLTGTIVSLYQDTTVARDVTVGLAYAQAGVVAMAPPVVEAVSAQAAAMDGYAAAASSAAAALATVAAANVAVTATAPNLGSFDSPSNAGQAQQPYSAAAAERYRDYLYYGNTRLADPFGPHLTKQQQDRNAAAQRWWNTTGTPAGNGRGGTLMITINAQGSIFETDQALRRLADRIARVMGIGGRLGPSGVT